MSDDAGSRRPGGDAPSSAPKQFAPKQGASRRTGDRYAAIVEALMAVRPDTAATDDATARFDAELAAAIAANRLDAETARALRWWQRASVRAAETYAATVARGVFTLTQDAQTAAAAEVAEAAASWQRSLEVRAALDANDASQADEPQPPAIDTRLQAPIVELAAVRLLARDPGAVKSALAGRLATAVRIESSVDTAAAASAEATADAPATPQPPDLTATTVTT